MANIIDSSWKEWINLNLERGCDIDGIFKILIDNGFEYQDIKEILDCEPSRSLDEIDNPLIGKKKESGDSGANLGQDNPERRITMANAMQVMTDRAEVFEVNDFLSRQECRQLVKLIKSALVPSTVVTPDPNDPNFRTSRTCDLSRVDSDLIRDIDSRICRYMGISPDYSEGIQGQYYLVGEEIKPHTDYFEGDELENAGDRGQRSMTCMIYLNEVEAGGETHFVNLDHVVESTPGKMLVWNNVDKAGNPNPDTMHHGCPVEKGYKAVITKWFRLQGPGEMLIKSDNENLPAYTPAGFRKYKIPKALFARIKKFNVDNQEDYFEEIVEDFITSDGNSGSELLELPPEFRDDIHRALQPKLEKWCGVSLQPTFVYGIRKYHNGATLKPHRDRVETHIISALLNIDQDVDEKWPLEIEDHYYRKHYLNLRPGEMLFYEGAKLDHGRPQPLKGRLYANVFVHYKPV